MTHNIPTTNVDLSHHLQRHVLIHLRQHGPAAYQELKPDGVEGNAYNYHLRQLKTSGLVILHDDRYELTSTGHLVSDAFSFDSKRLMLRPHHYMMLLITAGDQVLTYQATREPLKGKVSLPSGKIHYGDSLKERVALEVKRRNLSEDYTTESICPINIRYLKNHAVTMHRPGNLWHVDYRGPLAFRQTDSGSTQWASIDEVIKNPVALPELIEGLKHLQAHNHDPIDLEWSLDR